MERKERFDLQRARIELEEYSRAKCGERGVADRKN